jgi:glycosyltransferase involved in cell wall biosynthesis
LQDPQRRKSMGDAGRQRLERLFSIETMISRFEGVYRDLTGIK